jgi:hypothetical protein
VLSISFFLSLSLFPLLFFLFFRVFFLVVLLQQFKVFHQQQQMRVGNLSFWEMEQKIKNKKEKKIK